MDRDDVHTTIRFAADTTDDDRVTAVYRCHRQLADLADTDNAEVKYCDSCRQSVFRVQDFDGFERAVAAGRCVWNAIDSSAANGAGEALLLLGLPAVFPYRLPRD